jgi:hypothetical protein
MERFNNELKKIHYISNKNSTFLTSENYKEILNEVLKFKKKMVNKKSSRD